jgi:FkbM family methyltransferase
MKITSHDRQIQKLSIANWKVDNGREEPMRYNYDLNENSVVYDLGGYRGDWAYKINEKYNCKVILLEPFPRWFKHCKERFENNPKVEVYGVAASDRFGKAVLSDGDQGSSLYLKTPNTETIELVDFAEFMSHEDKIDLIKINIEGEEFAVIETLYKNGMLSRITDLQIQTHPFVDNAGAKYIAMDQQLNATHKKTYFYQWIWENWTLR